jgi:hypothetical protein
MSYDGITAQNAVVAVMFMECTCPARELLQMQCVQCSKLFHGR